MAARPRKNNISIPNLYPLYSRKVNKVYWRYKHPITGKFHSLGTDEAEAGLAPIFPDTFYRLTHYWFAAADIPVANDIPVHCADAIRCNVRRPPQGSLPLLTRQVLA